MPGLRLALVTPVPSALNGDEAVIEHNEQAGAWLARRNPDRNRSDYRKWGLKTDEERAG
jgi:hypothetical protein